MSRRQPNAENAGFTLVELLTSMAVLVIVAGISVPSFTRLVERQRVDAALQRLETDLALARNTAMARRQSVVVCPRSADAECQPGLDWSAGWVVFVEDPQHPGLVGERLWVQQSFVDAGDFIAVGSNRQLLRYRHNGTSAGSNLTIHVCLHGWLMAQQVVSNTGRSRRHRLSGEQACPS